MKKLILAAIGAALCATTPAMAKPVAPPPVIHETDSFANTENWQVRYKGRAFYKTFGVDATSFVNNVWLYRVRDQKGLGHVRIRVEYIAEDHSPYVTLRGGERIETIPRDLDVFCNRVCLTKRYMDVPVTKETFDKYREAEAFPVQLYGFVINVPANDIQRLFDVGPTTLKAPAS